MISVCDCDLLCIFLLDSSGGLSPSLLSPSSGPSSSSIVQATPNPTPQPQKAISNKKAEALQYSGNKCPECQAQFSRKEEVAEHFQEIKPPQTTVSLFSVRKRAKEQYLFSNDMNIDLIAYNGHSFLPLLFSSHAQSVLLPCSCPTAAVQQLINASTKVAHHTSAQSVGARPSSLYFKHTWTRPVCTFHAALDTGVTSSGIPSDLY